MNKVNSFSLSSIVLSTSGAPFWGILTSFILFTSKNSSLLSLLIGFTLSLLISRLILKFHSLYPNLSLIDKFKKIYKKKYKIICIFNSLLILLMFIALSYRLTVFLSSQYLIETPKAYFHIIILFTSFYIANKGIEAITRLSLLSFYLGMIIFAFDIFSLFQYAKIDNLLPLINSSFIDIIKSSLLTAIYFSIPTYFITIVKKDDITNKEQFTKHYYFFYILSFIVIFSAIAITMSIYGISLANIFDYPLYTVLKRIKLFAFIDSIENISIMLWILYVVNFCSIAIYNVNKTLSETLNINNKIINIITFSISFFIPYFLLMNNNYVEAYNYVYIPAIIEVLVILLLIITLIKSKKKM